MSNKTDSTLPPITNNVISPAVNIEQIETPEFTNHVIKNIVQKEYDRDITDSLLWRKRWKKLGYMFYAMSKILALVGSALAFFEPYFKLGYLAMISGCLNLIALYLWQCGDDSLMMSSEKTRIVNEYLRVLQIEEFPQDSTVQVLDLKQA